MKKLIRFSDNLLRIVCYATAGIFIFNNKWYLGLPVGMILIFIGLTMENKTDALVKGEEQDG